MRVKFSSFHAVILIASSLIRWQQRALYKFDLCLVHSWSWIWQWYECLALCVPGCLCECVAVCLCTSHCLYVSVCVCCVLGAEFIWSTSWPHKSPCADTKSRQRCIVGTHNSTCLLDICWRVRKLLLWRSVKIFCVCIIHLAACLCN